MGKVKKMRQIRIRVICIILTYLMIQPYAVIPVWANQDVFSRNADALNRRQADVFGPSWIMKSSHGAWHDNASESASFYNYLENNLPQVAEKKANDGVKLMGPRGGGQENVQTQAVIEQPEKGLGDIDGDGVVSRADLNLLANSYRAKKGDENYSINADFNKDDIVGFDDLTAFGAVYGRTYNITPKETKTSVTTITPYKNASVNTGTEGSHSADYMTASQIAYIAGKFDEVSKTRMNALSGLDKTGSFKEIISFNFNGIVLKPGYRELMDGARQSLEGHINTGTIRKAKITDGGLEETVNELAENMDKTELENDALEAVSAIVKDYRSVDGAAAKEFEEAVREVLDRESMKDIFTNVDFRSLGKAFEVLSETITQLRNEFIQNSDIYNNTMAEALMGKQSLLWNFVNTIPEIDLKGNKIDAVEIVLNKLRTSPLADTEEVRKMLELEKRLNRECLAPAREVYLKKLKQAMTDFTGTVNTTLKDVRSAALKEDASGAQALFCLPKS